MKKKLKKWQEPKISQLKIKETEGGNSSHSEGYVKPNGTEQSGRSFGGATG